jgi:A/G-specific adenine glycosylase
MFEFQKFNKSLFDWYKENARKFPWRDSSDPYKIWISEIMSQQTQIERVAEKFYPRFIKRFPTIEVLANSDWKEVYEYWDGLGYYSRGKNLLKAVKIIQKKYKGIFPVFNKSPFTNSEDCFFSSLEFINL